MPINIQNYPWPDWEPVEKIGKGGFGFVYKAKKHTTFLGDKWSAVKVMYIHNDKDKAEKLSKEIEFMLQLSNHPNVVHIYDYSYNEHKDGASYDLFIRMELLNSFEKSIKGVSLSTEETVRLGTTMCGVLSVLEQKKIVHRDIKPANILVDDAGNYKLGDFGIARVIDSDTTHTGAGTPIYAAPEVRGGHYDQRVDIYSLGLTLWVCLNHGRIPFVPMEGELTGEDEDYAYAMLRGKQPLPDAVDSTPELMTVIRKACAYKPEDRYNTAAEFCEALKNLGKKTEVIDDFEKTQPETKKNNEPVIEAARPIQPKPGVKGAAVSMYKAIPARPIQPKPGVKGWVNILNFISNVLRLLLLAVYCIFLVGLFPSIVTCPGISDCSNPIGVLYAFLCIPALCVIFVIMFPTILFAEKRSFVKIIIPIGIMIIMIVVGQFWLNLPLLQSFMEIVDKVFG